jgi:hypothetical protein
MANVEPLDLAAASAFYNVGPQLPGLIRTQWTMEPVPQPVTRWQQLASLEWVMTGIGAGFPPYGSAPLLYVPHGVYFNGATYLRCNKIINPPSYTLPIVPIPDGSYLTIAGWFRTIWDNSNTPNSPISGNSIPVFVVDPSVNYGPSLIAGTLGSGHANRQTSVYGQVADSEGEISFDVQDQLNVWAFSSIVSPPGVTYGYSYGEFTPNGPQWENLVWQHIMMSFNADVGEAKIWINGTPIDVTSTSQYGGTSLGLHTSLPFPVRMAGRTAFLGSDGGNFYTGDMADFSVWSSNIEIGPEFIFLDNRGSPTLPSYQVDIMAAQHAAQPIFMLTADPLGSAASFGNNNLGSAQPFSVVVGGLTSSTTNPTGINS